MSSNPTTPVPMAAVSASTFDQSIGVNVHMGFTSTPYGNVAAVESDLAYLGIDHVRDSLLDWPGVQTSYQQLAAAGIKFDFAIPVYAGTANTVNLPEFISMLNAFEQAHPGSITAIEGPNEVNIWPVTYAGGTTLADQALLQQALYAAVRADPNLNGIPVYDLTLAFTDPSQYAQLGNLSSAADFGNEHAYVQDTVNPAVGLNYLLGFPKIDTPGLPLVITETGYETDPADTYSGVDQTVQAKLTLDTLMDAYKDGVSETYLYELIDEGGQEFGLFNADGTPKLAATAIHNLTTILADNGNTSSFTPGSLSYAVPDLPSNGNQLLLEKSNGTFDLALWAESQIWDPTTQSEIVAPPETTTVEFGQVQKLVLVFDPLQGTAPIAVYSNVQSIQVTLTDHPLIIETPSPTASLATPVINGAAAGGGNIASGGGTTAHTLTLSGTGAAASTMVLYDGSVQIGVATVDANGAWSFVTSTLTDGVHNFTALNTDAVGDISQTSTAISVTIESSAPTVSSVEAFGFGVDTGSEASASAKIITLTLDLSEAVTVTGGVPTLLLANGGTAVYSGGSGSSDLTFSYTLGTGQAASSLAVTAVQLNGANIVDNAGVSANLSGALTNPVEIIAESGRGPTATLPTDIIAPSTPDSLTAADLPGSAGFVLPGGSASTNTVPVPGIAFANPIFSLVAPGATNPGLMGEGGFVQQSVASASQATLGHLPNSNQGGDMLAATNGNNHVGVALGINYMASSFAAAAIGNSSAMAVADGSHFASQSLLTTPQHG